MVRSSIILQTDYGKMDPYEPRNFGRSGNGPQQTPSNYTIIASSQD